MIDFDKLRAALDPSRILPEWLPDGKRVGGEWVARNPTRGDNRPGSFSINLRSGAWGDFATGDEGGDLISLWAYLRHDNDNAAAARDLAAQYGIDVGAPPAPAAARPAAARPAPPPSAPENVETLEQPRPVMPVPEGVPDPDFRHPSHGEPSRVWPYYDREGRILLFVCRFDHPDGRKDIVPRSWCEHPGKPARWTWRGVTGRDKRPLYGLDRLAALPDADVLIVEGEKAADAAQALVGRDIAVVAWLGGTSTADRVDLRPLRGRRVTLWPDFDRKTYPGRHERAGELRDLIDQPGPKAMAEIAQGLAGIASSVLMVAYDHTADRFPDGWDLADGQAEGWKAANVAGFLASHAADWRAVMGGRAEPEPEAQADDEPANDNEPAPTPLEHDLNPFTFPHVSEKGAPQNTVENLAHLLREYGIGIAYNVIAKEVEIEIPGRAFARDNAAANALATITSLCARNRVPKTELGDYITLIADANRRNPAVEFIEATPWDGVDRIRDLALTLDPVDPDLAAVLIRRWVVGAVAAAYTDEGVALQGVLVLQGPQNAGKTTWCRVLAGCRDDLFVEGLMLNPADRDSVKPAISKWIAELGEIDATFRKADIAALKSFVTRPTDELRLPYARASSTYPRRTAFCATVNDKRFLRDETGNRRFWTIETGPGMIARHGVDIAQVWAQAAHLWRAGEPFNLQRDELERLNAANEAHTEISPIEELISTKFDWADASRPEPMTATDVLISIGYDRPNRQQVREASAVLHKLTGAEAQKHSKGRRVFWMPYKGTPGSSPGSDELPF
jgi:hypothetical protein